MFTAYARLSDGTPRTLEAAPDLAALWSDKEAVLWIDLEQPTEEEIRAVDAVIDLDNEALDDCLHGEQRPRVDEYENYIFLVVYGLLDVRFVSYWPVSPRFGCRAAAGTGVVRTFWVGG